MSDHNFGLCPRKHLCCLGEFKVSLLERNHKESQGVTVHKESQILTSITSCNKVTKALLV